MSDFVAGVFGRILELEMGALDDAVKTMLLLGWPTSRLRVDELKRDVNSHESLGARVLKADGVPVFRTTVVYRSSVDEDIQLIARDAEMEGRFDAAAEIHLNAQKHEAVVRGTWFFDPVSTCYGWVPLTREHWVPLDPVFPVS